MNLKPFVLAVAVALAGYLGVVELADATLTTHQEQDPHSQMAVVVHGSLHDDAEHGLAVGVESLIRTCQLEVGRDIGDQDPESLGDGDFGVVFQPALDAADQRQFAGCVGDLLIDHLQASVRSYALIDG